MNTYAFSAGNSNVGPIGFCARIRATSKKEALEKLRKALPDSWQVEAMDHQKDVEYIQVYFNGKAVTMTDIEDVDETKEAADGHA